MFRPTWPVVAIFMTLLSVVHARAADAPGTLVIAEPFAPRSGWSMETDDAFVLTKAGCMEMLARVDFDGTLKPWLAKSWTQTQPTVWEIALRDDVRFQDGKAMDATAVANSLNKVLSGTTQPRSFSRKLIQAVEAVDAYTVRITTIGPNALLPFRISSSNTGILSPSAYREGAGAKIDPVRACTGPFTVTDWVPQQSIRLERNEAYWGPKAHIAKVEVRFVPDAEGRATAVKSGEAQAGVFLPVSVLASLRADTSLTLLSADQPRVTTLYLNNANPKLSDPRVRRAIQSAIDTDAIVAGVFEGAGKPAMGPFGPAEPWAPKDMHAVRQDLAHARALLAEAGVAPGSLTLQLLAYTERSEYPDLAAVIQDELKQVGITVALRVANYAALEPDMLSGRFDMGLVSRSHLVDLADPGAFLAADYGCGGGYNLSHLCDKTIDAELERSNGLADPAQRQAIYAKVAQILQDQAVSVFLVREQQFDVTSKKLLNYRIHPLNQYEVTSDLVLAP